MVTRVNIVILICTTMRIYFVFLRLQASALAQLRNLGRGPAYYHVSAAIRYDQVALEQFLVTPKASLHAQNFMLATTILR